MALWRIPRAFVLALVTFGVGVPLLLVPPFLLYRSTKARVQQVQAPADVPRPGGAAQAQDAAPLAV